jgi:Ku protein
MAARSNWKGYLRLSLVSCPIALYAATTESEKVRFHQLNKATGNRVRYRKVDEATEEEVTGDDIVKAYEVSKGNYIEITDDDMAAVQVESTRTIDIDQFVPREEIDDLYNNRRSQLDNQAVRRHVVPSHATTLVYHSRERRDAVGLSRFSRRKLLLGSFVEARRHKLQANDACSAQRILADLGEHLLAKPHE